MGTVPPMDQSGLRDANSFPPVPPAAAAAQLTRPTEPAPPRVDLSNGGNGHSLAELAARDLDAALQLLAERAQYITDAAGAAIALRRGDHNDMLCRASTGSTAPELGALLSMEYGLSGESLRTRQVQQCDDAQHDARVNREACRRLGIASVVVMPIVSGDQVLGVFELFSGRRNAFEARDISALQRLSSMVELAIRFAVAAQSTVTEDDASSQPFEPSGTPTVTAQREVELEVSEVRESTASPSASVVHATSPVGSKPSPAEQLARVEEAPNNVNAKSAISPPMSILIDRTAAEETDRNDEAETADSKIAIEEIDSKKETEKGKTKAIPKKPLFWSAAQVDRPAPAEPPASASDSAPPTLRKLKQCQACGFPISQDRTLCVECEEKQWRGRPSSERLVNPKVEHAAQNKEINTPAPANVHSISAPAIISAAQSESKLGESSANPAASAKAPDDSSSSPSPMPSGASATESAISRPVAEPNPQPDTPTFSIPFLGSTLQTESWFATNKYMIGALLLVAIILALLAILR